MKDYVLHNFVYYFLKKLDCENKITNNSDKFEVSQREHSDVELFGSSRLRKINDVLKDCAQGQCISKTYKREKELTERDKSKICDMIITDLENRNEVKIFI